MCSSEQKQKNYDGHWAKHFWRPTLAYVYAMICVVDFVIMPVTFEYIKSRDSLEEVVSQIDRIQDTEVRLALIKRADYAGGRSWEPVTMKEGGFFHLAFGALLTGAVVTRGMKKTEQESDKQS